jgi:hypothetical protein
MRSITPVRKFDYQVEKIHKSHMEEIPRLFNRALTPNLLRQTNAWDAMMNRTEKQTLDLSKLQTRKAFQEFKTAGRVLDFQNEFY